MALLGVTGYVPEPFIKLEVAPATGSTTTPPPGVQYDWVVYTNPGTIAAQTLVLPTSPVDGQIFIVSNFAIITAFTLSPAAVGFTNGASLAAGNGIWLAFSAPSNQWFTMNF